MLPLALCPVKSALAMIEVGEDVDETVDVTDVDGRHRHAHRHRGARRRCNADHHPRVYRPLGELRDVKREDDPVAAQPPYWWEEG